MIVLDEPTIGDARPVLFLDCGRKHRETALPGRLGLRGSTRLPRAVSCLRQPHLGSHASTRRVRGIGWAGDGDPPDEPPDTVPSVGADWEATPWRRCTRCGYSESQPNVSVGIKLDDVLPEAGNPKSG